MIRTAEVIRFDRLAGHGRNNPLRVVVETADSEECEAVLKPAGWKELTTKSIVRETIATTVAGLLGIPVCEPFIVSCSQKMIDSIPDDTIRRDLQKCKWPAFASKHAGKQWRNWSRGDKIDLDRWEEALQVFIFDALVDNADRCWKNPNLLVSENHLRAIDHEFCFGFADLLGQIALPPWRLGGLNWLTAGDQENVLYRELKASGYLQYGDIQNSWAGLADDDLDAILEYLPTAWGDGKALARIAIQRVKDVRNNIDDCIKELKRVLS